MAKLSIITITLNNKVGLERTIKSIISQKSDDYELIIIDGGSSDGTSEVLDNYKGKISHCISETDSGIYNAMNKGIELASGNYCNFLNSGDIYHDSNVLKRVLNLLNSKDIYIGNCYNFNPNGSYHSMWKSPEKIYFSDLFIATPNHQATFIKTSTMKENLYNENYKLLGDFDFFMKTLIMKNCSYQKLDIFIVDYEVGGLSSTNMNLYYQERDKILSTYIPIRILEDYKLNNNYHYFNKLIRFIKNRKWFINSIEQLIILIIIPKKIILKFKSLWK